MTIEELKNEINNYNSCETQRSWTMEKKLINYENDYIEIKRIDSSNKWVPEDTMSKMWSIIFYKKQDFYNLPKYRTFKNFFNVNITKVTRGVLKGNYGLRIYDMKREPNIEVIKMILDFIFID